MRPRGVDANDETETRIGLFDPSTERRKKKEQRKEGTVGPLDGEPVVVNGGEDGVEVEATEKTLDVGVEKNAAVIGFKLLKRDVKRVLAFQRLKRASESVFATVRIGHGVVEQNMDVEKEGTPVGGFPCVDVVDKDDVAENRVKTAVNEIEKWYHVHDRLIMSSSVRLY